MCHRAGFFMYGEYVNSNNAISKQVKTPIQWSISSLYLCHYRNSDYE